MKTSVGRTVSPQAEDAPTLMVEDSKLAKVWYCVRLFGESSSCHLCAGPDQSADDGGPHGPTSEAAADEPESVQAGVLFHEPRDQGHAGESEGTTVRA